MSKKVPIVNDIKYELLIKNDRHIDDEKVI